MNGSFCTQAVLLKMYMDSLIASRQEGAIFPCGSAGVGYFKIVIGLGARLAQD
eukprot:CAMPEP_0202385114 /NCGR_PEP_ID=MMETSP1127-20130417/58994_1 /ASSEMBLY_ACC=CAM_ASM_000462 /TAXON_ID=3047 /ORGANISM="Dunaliella tertiolecta, Strain CCMP1320" /LENGTH=52 /DNA_ID=CAMNT_0048985169 /DNA_START=123 /DNA_END=281 /DNA_ORIENTATION=+